MTTSSEDVLLQMGEVRFKKGDGTLYVMNERLAWMAEHRDTVAVSHRFQDVKMQKISPEGKPKVQLQVVLHDGNSSTFHFVNRSGAAAQIADRDKVKELLQQLLPNFKRKVDKELQEKNQLLTENPTLLQLYKDLVITQVITSEEFWTTHAKNYAQAASGGAAGSGNQTKKQDIGVSGAFLADIKPQTDGCNGLKYNLTSDIIECIFKTYPAVKRKHTEYVPSKYTESEFWTKFFQSHYFHRDRINAGSKDLFTECAKIDDQQIKQAVEQSSGDPLLDLRAFDDTPVDECYGAPESQRKVGTGNIVHQSMIKRFNQHSIMVLKTCTPDTTPPAVSATEPPQSNLTNNNNNSSNNNNKMPDDDSINSNLINGIKSKHKSQQNDINNMNNGTNIISSGAPEVTLSPKIKKARIHEKIVYDDLIDDRVKVKMLPQLNLSKIERYLHGPVPITTNTDVIEEPQELDYVQDQILQDTEMWGARTPHKVLVSATSAVNALGELSPGGALMRGFQEQSIAQLVPPEFERELKNLYLSLLELLRHFWKAFPPTTPELESTAMRMHEALQRYQMAKLKPFEERAMREVSPIGSSLTQHLNQLLQSAFRRFVTWQERKIRQHR